VSSKTNQFNLSLRRYRRDDILEFLCRKGKAVYSFELSDKLSDSGNVGSVYYIHKERQVIISELCISCRALGRELENYFLAASLIDFCRSAGNIDTVLIEYTVGQRNKPALDWLESFSSSSLVNQLNPGAINNMIIKFCLIEAKYEELNDELDGYNLITFEDFSKS
jgi:FkbH-like protein